MKHYLALSLFVLTCCSLRAQYTGDELYFLLPTDTMLVKAGPAPGFFAFEHRLAPEQTIYGAAKFYGVSVEQFYARNPKLRDSYDVGDVLTVPIPVSVVQPRIAPDSLAWFVPVRYRLQKDETLFGLATRRLGWPNVKPLMELNPGLEVARLKPGAVLNIGYMIITGLPESNATLLSPYQVRNQGMKRIWDARANSAKIKSQDGKAAWTKRGDQNKYMVLHRTAPVNSMIEVTDPRSRRTIYAKVIGRIPEQIYHPKIIVVVSPLIVKTFGVRDKEFYVKTRHY